MRPRVYSVMWTNVSTGEKTRRWHVEFVDSCGCTTEEDFGTSVEARRFAHHVASGGSRWEFVA